MQNLRLNLELTQMGPQLRLVRLQQFLEQQAQAHNALRMGIDRRQSMAVSNVEGPKRKVQLNW